MYSHGLRRHSGFTLIEVMVAVFVLAIGLLGIAAMQAFGIQQTGNTYFRTQADLLARDIADRMRANREAVLDGNYEFDGAPQPAQDCGTAGSDCSLADMADYDLAQWITGMAEARLPAGAGTITKDAGAAYYVITVRWDERRNGAAGEGCDPADEGDLACLRLFVEI